MSAETGKAIAKALAEGGLVRFDSLDLSHETKAAADAELSKLLHRLGIEEPLKRVYPA